MQIDLSPPQPDGTPPRHILVGFSGGLDSTVLLHLLARTPAAYACGLSAIHVHHGLQAAADDWAAHCLQLCARLGLPCEVVRVEVDRESGLGLEAAARHARQAAFAERLRPGDLIALAHHQDDQAETVLLRALRAAGPDGLSAMRPLRRFANGWLWRPLLGIARTQLHAWANRQQLHWIEDPSNATDEPDRNFLRNRVLPLLRTRWPQASDALATLAALQADSTGLLATGDAEALASTRTLDPAVLRIDALYRLPEARRKRVVRCWTASLGLPPLPARVLHWCEDTRLQARPDRNPVCDWAGHRLQLWRGLLHAGPIRAPLPALFNVQWNAHAPLWLPDGGRLLLEGPETNVEWTVRPRLGGERIHLPGRTHSHALKHVLQTLAVPPWQRTQLPLLLDADGQVLAAGDLVFSAGFDTWLRNGGHRLRWHPPGTDATPDTTAMA